MKKINLIYLLYSCNQWKETASMSLIMASTSPTEILIQIQKEVQKENMELDEGYQMYKDYSPEEKITEINNYLDYGYIDIVVDGEIQ